MDAPCKLRSSKPGKARQQTSVLRRRHSITVRGATVKRGSANTPKKWKPRRPRKVWRRKHAPIFVTHGIPADAGRNIRTVSSTNHANGLSREARDGCPCTSSQSLRGARRANRSMVEPGTYVFTRCEESFD